MNNTVKTPKLSSIQGVKSSGQPETAEPAANHPSPRSPSALESNRLIAWHYTTAQNFDLIIESKVLLPADIGVIEPELPILWFSTHPKFEPSAHKAIAYSDGTSRTASLEEMYERTGGLARFGCSISKLQCGENLRKAAKMKSLVWRRLVKGGLQMRANPSDWWGYVGEMPLDEIIVEVMNSSMQWCRVPADALYNCGQDVTAAAAADRTDVGELTS